jgi:uncharacterized protein
MDFLRQQLQTSPIHARLVPYALIVLITVFQDFSGPLRFWMYLLKVLVGAWCIWEMRSLVPEIRWAVSWEAVAVGVLVFVFWVGLDPYYPRIEFLFAAGTPWNPFVEFGGGSAMGFFFVAVRTLGSAIVVPPIEEAFYRSFLYRFFVRKNFAELPFHRLHWLSLFVTSALFGLVHYQWLAGFLCGLCYQALVIRKNRLGDAMTAHAITNFLLGIYVVWRGAWQFW